MATSEPLPQRPTRKSRRLRGQEPQQATPEKVVGSVATPPFGGLSPCRDHTPSSTPNDARSGSPRSHSTRTDLATATDLLSLRREYHRAATQAMMCSHHLEFLKKCDEASHVPPGLRLSLRPQVYASNTSTVDTEIRRIIDAAQRDIIQALREHYSSLHTRAQQNIDKTLTTLSSSLPHLPPSQVTSHDAAMERTKANIEKKSSKLAARTERKLKHQLSTQDKATPCTHTPQDFHAPGPREKVATKPTPRDRTSTNSSPPSLQTQTHPGLQKKKRRKLPQPRKYHPFTLSTLTIIIHSLHPPIPTLHPSCHPPLHLSCQHPLSSPSLAPSCLFAFLHPLCLYTDISHHSHKPPHPLHHH